MDNGRLFEEMLGSWATTRRNLLNEVENIPAERFDYRPHAGSRSVSQLCRHIAASSMMFARELARPDGNFARLPLPGLLDEHGGHLPHPVDKAGVKTLLESTWAEAEATLRGAGPDLVERGINSLFGHATTGRRMLGFGESHEFYHAGQLTVYARCMGVVPALTKQLQQYGIAEKVS
jgi:uncharacterized damage-inducible protein DinB